MGRIKLKIKRLETIDSNLEAYAKRKSGIVIQEGLLREEAQMARVKELEVMLKQLEAGLKEEKDIKNVSKDHKGTNYIYETIDSRMGRIKLKIKRLETIDSNLEAYAKRKSGIVIQEGLMREEAQKARVKELEVMLKQLEAGLKGEKDIKNVSKDLAIKIKYLEGKLSSNDKEVASIHTTSEDLETLRSEHDAVRKEQEARLNELVKAKKKYDELLKFGGRMSKELMKTYAAQIDVERAKVKMLEQHKKEIGKGVYLTIKEGLRKKFPSDVDVERAKVKQLEQNRKENEKGASLTLKDDLSKNLASDIDVERVALKQVEQNRKEIEKRAYWASKKGLRKKLA